MYLLASKNFARIGKSIEFTTSANSAKCLAWVRKSTNKSSQRAKSQKQTDGSKTS